jgi:hypothetical protein
MASFLLFSGSGGWACLEAAAVVASLQDMAAVGQAVGYRRGHLGIAEE